MTPVRHNKTNFGIGVEQLESRRCFAASTGSLDAPFETYVAERPAPVSVATNALSGSSDTVHLEPETTVDTGFSVDFDFIGSISSQLRLVAATAANRWASVIVGDLPDVQIEGGTTIDDVLIQFEVADLQVGLAGVAGFTDIRVGGTNEPANGDPTGGGLPYRGKVILNSRYIDSSDIGHVIAHEIGHVLGFGTLWQNDVGTFSELVEGIGTDNPVFIGENALREFNYLFQNSDQSVPLSSRSRTVPQTYDGRYGTHWQDAVFNTHAGASELMTSSFPLNQNTGTPSDVFLSRVTVGALEDFGYSVDYAAAESYPVLNDGVPASQPTYPTADYLPEIEVFGPALPANFAGVDSGSGFSFSSDPDRNIARRLPPRITYANRSAVILPNDQETKTHVLQSIALLGSGDGVLSLSHLSAKHLAWLAAWASFEDSP